MADTKITALATLASLADADLFVAIDDVAGTPASTSVRADTLKAYAGAYYAQTADEVTAGVTPTDFTYLPGNVLRYGADDTGVTDSASNIQDAFNSAGAGGTVLFPPGTYRVDTPLILTDATINISGYGATIDFSNNVTAAAVALTIEGSASGTTTTLTANAVQGATSLTVASETNFAADDWISIESNTELLGTTATYIRGELSKILSTALNTLNLYSGTKIDYDQGTPTVTITKLNMISKPSVEGLTLQGSGVIAHDHVGIQISYAVEPIIRDVTVIDCSSTGLDFNRCTHGLMTGCYVENCNDNVGSTGYSYSMSPLSQFCIIDSCRAKRFKHAFTTGGLLPVWNWVVSNCTFENQISTFSTQGIATHANGVNGTFTNNTLDYAYAGLQFRGPRNTVVGNTITNITTQQGIQLSLDGPQESIVSDNRIEAPFGISVTNDTGITTFSTTISNNACIGVAVNGATIGSGVNITGPNVSVIGNSLRNFSPGIVTIGNDAVIRANTILDTIATGTAYGIHVSNGTDTTIDSNTIRCPNSSTMTRGILLAAGATNTRIINNDIADYTNTAIDDSGTATTRIANLHEGVIETNVGATQRATTAQLEDVAHVVNTGVNKRQGTQVFNTTTNRIVYAISNTDGAVWVFADGTTAHTPV